MTPSVGAKLRQARFERRLSLQDATKATKIQPWVLEALERDELPGALSPVYVKGFLSTYAKFLELDPAPLIAQLLPAQAGQPADAPVAAPAGAPRFEGFWPWVRRAGSLALGLGMLLLVVSVSSHRWRPRQVPHQQASLSVAQQRDAIAPELSKVLVEPVQPLELVIVARRPTWISVKADGNLLAQQKLARGAQETWKARRRFELVIGTPAKVDVLLNGQSISPLALAHRGRLAITHSGITALEEDAPTQVGSTR